MAGNQFSVERPTVQAAVGHVRDVHAQISGLITSLTNQLEPVLAGGTVWRGDAQLSFVNVHERWNAATTKINQALDDIGNQLQTSNQVYQQSDQTSSSTVTSAGTGV